MHTQDVHGGTVTQGVTLLRRSEVEKRVGLGASAIYRLIRVGKFPQPVRKGRKYARWPSDVVDRWVSDLIREAAGSGAPGARE